MKRSVQISSLLLIVAAFLLINACKKTGPTGPQGPQGQTGKNGTQKVISSTFTMNSWSFTAPYYYMNLHVPELTANNVDSALVMVYFSTIGSNWFALPYTQYHSPYNYYMGFVASADTVQVTWVYDTSLSSGSDPNTYYGTTIKCKVVVVPPAMRKPNVNHLSYLNVKAAYNLKD
jgi:hypothetical protein